MTDSETKGKPGSPFNLGSQDIFADNMFVASLEGISSGLVHCGRKDCDCLCEEHQALRAALIGAGLLPKGINHKDPKRVREVLQFVIDRVNALVESKRGQEEALRQERQKQVDLETRLTAAVSAEKASTREASALKERFATQDAEQKAKIAKLSTDVSRWQAELATTKESLAKALESGAVATARAEQCSQQLATAEEKLAEHSRRTEELEVELAAARSSEASAIEAWEAAEQENAKLVAGEVVDCSKCKESEALLAMWEAKVVEAGEVIQTLTARVETLGTQEAEVARLRALLALKNKRSAAVGTDGHASGTNGTTRPALEQTIQGVQHELDGLLNLAKG